MIPDHMLNELMEHLEKGAAAQGLNPAGPAPAPAAPKASAAPAPAAAPAAKPAAAPAPAQNTPAAPAPFKPNRAPGSPSMSMQLQKHQASIRPQMASSPAAQSFAKGYTAQRPMARPAPAAPAPAPRPAASPQMTPATYRTQTLGRLKQMGLSSAHASASKWTPQQMWQNRGSISKMMSQAGGVHKNLSRK